MTITQTVDIPVSRQITLNVPPEVPAGRAILSFTPTPAVKSRTKDDSANPDEAIENLCGIGKRLGGDLTVEDFLKMGREDLRIEEVKYDRMFG